MILRIGELVRPNAHGRFSKDVQLGTFESDPVLNLELAQSYIFTSSAREPELGSVELLSELCHAYLAGEGPNRFGVVATFGHGKSHFAVAVANFFGTVDGSPESVAVLEGLKSALGDDPLLDRFHKFKEAHRPFLVVLLRGDESSDLSSHFYRALEGTLARQEETKDLRPPFWFTAAETFLQLLMADRADQANAFLARHDADLALLLDRIKARDDSARQLSIDLFQHLNGVKPDFEGTTSLREMVEWAADQLCGSGKPFGGVLILFDEFSTFISTYAGGQRGAASSPLQDLLNGVDNRHGRVAFVAFAQHDPKAAVAAAGAGQSRVDNVLRELDRIDKVYTLRSVLEDVLDSYLQQDQALWDYAFTDSDVERQFASANDLAWKIFQERYVQALHWSPKRFRVTVTEGSFPLHPATTALLSAIEFRAAGQTRTALQFASDAVHTSANAPLLESGRLNWTRPVRLVDYFEEMLEEQSLQDYRAAGRQLGADVPDEYGQLLKAMLLLTVGKVRTKDAGFSRTIAEFVGIDTPQAVDALEDLERRGVIRRDPVGGHYTFWPAGRGAYQVEAKLGEKLNQRPLTHQDVLTVKDFLLKHGSLLPIAVDVPWGNAQDWEADQVLLLRGEVSRDSVNELLKALVVQPGKSIGARALVAWLLAENDADVAWYRNEAAGVLDAAIQGLGNSAPPVILMRPRSPNGDILTLVRRVAGLKSFSPEEVRDVGSDAYNAVVDRDRKGLEKLLVGLQRQADPVVPMVYRGTDLGQPTNLARYLHSLLLNAFRLGPRDFFIHYKASATKFRTGVSAVAQALASGKLTTEYSALKKLNPVAGEIVDKYLSSSGRWRLLGPSMAPQQPASGSPLSHGWEALDSAVQEDSKAVGLRDVLITLLNPPYGYDFQSALLLFTAWYGYHRRELSLSVDGQLRDLVDVMTDNKKGGALAPPDIVATLGRASLSRTSLSEIEKGIRAILDAIDRGESFGQYDAEQAISELEQYEQAGRDVPVEQRFRLVNGIDKLKKDLEQAREYDKTANDLAQMAVAESDVFQLIDGLKRLPGLPKAGCVVAAGPSRHDLQQSLQTQLKEAVELSCAALEKPRSSEEVTNNQRRLNQLRSRLDTANLTGLVKRVDEASTRIRDKKDDLLLAQVHDRNDEQLLIQLKTMEVRHNTGLATCRAYLEQLNSTKAYGQDAKQALRQKRDQLTKASETLVEYMTQLPQQIDAASDPAKANALYEAALSRKTLYDETSEGVDLNQILERLRVVAGALYEADKLGRAPMHGSEDVTSIGEGLDSLITDTAPHLSELQIATLEAVRTRTEQRAEESVREALAWLSAMEEASEDPQADPEELMDSSKATPAFLPADELPRLEQIRERLRARLAEDVAQQIEHLFVKIGDKDQQFALVTRLMQLLQSGALH